MRYISTRNKSIVVNDIEAVLNVYASDGGLYVPEFIPKLSKDFLDGLHELSLEQRLAKIFSLFLTTFSQPDLIKVCEQSLSEHNLGASKPYNLDCMNRYSGQDFVLSFIEGNTGSIKDISQLLAASLLKMILDKYSEEYSDIQIINASTGYLALAGMEAFKGKKNLNLLALLPESSLTAVQQENLHYLGINKNSNNISYLKLNCTHAETQKILYELLASDKLKQILKARKQLIVSTNSYSWLSILSLIAIFVSMYIDMLKESYLFSEIDSEQESAKLPESFNLAVTDGQNAELMAAYYTQLMGLPLNKIIVASNKNKTIAELFRTGELKFKSRYYETNTPACDRRYSNNIERFIFEISNRDDKLCYNLAQSIKKDSNFTIPKELLRKIQKNFVSGFSDNESVLQSIADIYDNYDYLADPHMALAYNVYNRYSRRADDNHKVVYLQAYSPLLFLETTAWALIKNWPARRTDNIKDIFSSLKTYYNSNFAVDGIKKKNRNLNLDYVAILQLLVYESSLSCPKFLQQFVPFVQERNSLIEETLNKDKNILKQGFENYCRYENEDVLLQGIFDSAKYKFNEEKRLFAKAVINECEAKEFKSFLNSYFGIPDYDAALM